MRRFPLALLGAGLAAASGCTTHISPYRAKMRDFPTTTYPKRPACSLGSIYCFDSRSPIEDDRAHAVGDIVVIQVDEASAANHTSTVTTNSKNKTPVTDILSAVAGKLVPGANLAGLIGDNSFSFGGGGSIDRKGILNATLPVRVLKVLPNQDLLVEGTKVVLVGNEEHHFYIGGIVRQADIRADGSVASSRVADAEIEYAGRGDLTDMSRAGWLSRIMSKVWPL